MLNEIYKTRNIESKLSFREEEIESLRNKDITKKNLRVFNNKKIFLASTIGERDDDDLIKAALEVEGTGLSYEYDLPKLIDQKFIEDSAHLNISIEQQCQKILKKLAPYKNQFIVSGGVSTTRATKELIRNDHSLLSDFQMNQFYLEWKHRDSAGIVDGFVEAHCSGEIDIDKTMDCFLPFFDVYENEVTVKNGKYPVCFISPEGLFNKLSESLRSDLYHDGSALYSGRMGEQIFSENFTLIDYQYHPASGHVYHYDGEGQVRQNPTLTLIEKGKIVRTIADLKNSKKYSIPNTANAIPMVGSHPRLGFYNLCFAPGQRDYKDIWKDYQNLIVVYLGFGGDTTATGDFSTPVQLAYLCQNGEITGRLPAMTVSEHIENLFSDGLLEVASNGFTPHCAGPLGVFEMNVLLN